MLPLPLLMCDVNYHWIPMAVQVVVMVVLVVVVVVGGVALLTTKRRFNGDIQ